MTFRPRGELLIVSRSPVKKKSNLDIILPDETKKSHLNWFTVLKVGEKVLDIKINDRVLAEDMFEIIDRSDETIGLLHQKYIHIIEEK